MSKKELKLRTLVDEADRIGLQWVLDGMYDIPELEFEAPPVILDIGANVGAASVWFAHRYPGCTIIAYDPHPDHCAAYRNNLLGTDNIFLCPYAVAGGEPRTVKLYDGRNGPGQRSIYNLGEQRDTYIEVLTMRAQDLPGADIVKVDTEGCELEILEEYRHLCGLSAVMLEWHRPEDKGKLISLLAAHGLSVHKEKNTSHNRGEMIFLRNGYGTNRP